MTDREAIDESIAHWKRMVEWVEKQPSYELADDMSMSYEIDEMRSLGDCALCKKYLSPSCTGCPLQRIGEMCNTNGSAWKAVASADTWGEWLYEARRMLKVLEEL